MIPGKLIRRERARFPRENCLYQVMFLKNNRLKDVRVEEVEKIDFEELGEHLQQGESVFITSRSDQKQSTR